jgi:hypothetical protein
VADGYSGLDFRTWEATNLRRAVPAPVPFPDHDEGAPCTLHLGTGETTDLNQQEEARSLAGSVTANSAASTERIGALEPVQKLRLQGLF